MNKLFVCLSLLIITASSQAKEIVAGELTRVILSNQNPNHIVCADGDVNDYSAPAHIPIQASAEGGNMFISYLFRRSAMGEVEFVTTPHVVHITCAGEVYSLQITPTENTYEKVILGDSRKQQLEKNVSLLRHRDIEDIIVDMTLATINNDLPPQYSVSREGAVLPPIFDGLKIVKRRKIMLNGVGLALTEYEIFSDSETQLSKRQFMRREFSQSMRAITIVGEVVTPKNPARLLIVEDKL